MPIYEYRCDACAHELEALQGISDDPLTECPECGESALKKRISASAFRLKGGGWYETDFKSGNKRNIAGERESTSGGGESKSTDKGSKSGSDSGASKESGKSGAGSSTGKKSAES